MEIGLFVTLYILTIFSIIYYYTRKINKLKNSILNDKTTNVLKEILSLSLKGEDIKSAAEKIAIVIRKYFKVNYCTVYINNNENLEILASNIKEDKELMKSYINKLFINMQYSAQIRTSKTSLSYPTAYNRKIQYSYFIPLTVNGETIGAIHIENTSIKNMNRIEKELLRVMVENISIMFGRFMSF